MLELDADLNVIAWNRPEDVAVVEDSGFGAAPLLFQPAGCPPLAAANAKNGMTYVWSREDLGAGPLWSARVGPGELGASFLAQPSYSPELGMFFISAARDYDDQGAIRTFDAVVGFKVGPRCELPARPTWTAAGVGRGPKSPPLIVGDVVFVPGGFDRNVFALDAQTGECCGRSACRAPCSRLSPTPETRCSSATPRGTSTRSASSSRPAWESPASTRLVYATATASASSRGSLRDTTCETPSPPIVTP